jgi:hypothetical protein
MLFKRKPREEQPQASAASPGQPASPSAVLRDELGLHQLWYLEMRLKEELARASRANLVFSLAAWEPRLLPGDEPDPEMIAKATRLIAGKLRSYDIVARVADYRFVGLLLDADYPAASTVAYRLKADIQTMVAGTTKWRAGVATFGRDGVDGDSLIQAAFRRMDEQSLAA